MTYEDIIRMAREAGMDTLNGWRDDNTVSEYYEAWPEQLERFAALVAATEREKVARWQIGSGYTTGHGDTIEDLLVELEWQVREAEREECAKVCEEGGKDASGRIHVQAWGAAKAIRARGNK